ncbi:phosphoribosylanthranilate isomerase [Amycolatopsis sp. CA-230715]|uniref:phosphoribosylanthranilate isomerase n=1 Tax=Amycolatopsis sp. CA-230715 TaxID=2745196 RepID=UPI001C0336CB|nr:phosphoribosylanthranilate isomerase [Amycolatopsis sp. CA-230715]QWF84050.1 N-(5'-phosphoribosyl)anthranilate isomerase [Amycolatopsis sp. CA-230715]
MLLKICGATRVADVDLLAAAGADLIGLWSGVPDGRAQLGDAAFDRLVRAVKKRGRTPVLVTLSRDVRALLARVEGSGVNWVQLHGYQTPAAVRALKSRGLTVVKVLHVRDGQCLERLLIDAYQRAGADLFLLDSMVGGRIGSTAHRLDPEVAASVVGAVDRPVLLAGGLTAANAGQFRATMRDHRFAGVDVDSGARDARGRFDADAVRAIRREWTAAVSA